TVDMARFDSAFLRFERFTWIVFTSANAVRSTVRRFKVRSVDLHSIDMPRVAVVGKATARAVLDAGWLVEVEAQTRSAAGLLEDMTNQPRGQVLLPQSALADTFLEDGLRERGYSVTKVAAYTLEPDE